MVDGILRAAALTRKHANQTEQFPTMIVYELIGPFLNMIFPCDFCHFYNPEDKTENTQHRQFVAVVICYELVRTYLYIILVC